MKTQEEVRVEIAAVDAAYKEFPNYATFDVRPEVDPIGMQRVAKTENELQGIRRFGFRTGYEKGHAAAMQEAGEEIKRQKGLRANDEKCRLIGEKGSTNASPEDEALAYRWAADAAWPEDAAAIFGYVRGLAKGREQLSASLTKAKAALEEWERLEREQGGAIIWEPECRKILRAALAELEQKGEGEK